MAPRQKRFRCCKKNRRDASNHRIEPCTTPYKKLSRAIIDNSNVEKWLYCFLGNLAAIEAEKKKIKIIPDTLRIHKRSQTAYRRFRSPTPYSWNRIISKSPVDVLQYTTDSDASTISNNEISSHLHEIRTNSIRIQDVRSLSNDIPAEKIVKRHALLKAINRYIISGKRCAKRYIRKALTFALEMGYLVSVNPEGKLLRISPRLINMIQRKKSRIPFIWEKSIKKATEKKRIRKKIVIQSNSNLDMKRRESDDNIHQANFNTKRLNRYFKKKSNVRFSRRVLKNDHQESVQIKGSEEKYTRTVMS